MRPLALDSRSGKPLLLVCDCENRRFMHVDRDGRDKSGITELTFKGRGLEKPASKAGGKSPVAKRHAPCPEFRRKAVAA